jgi:WD40 repeat protein
MNKKKLERSRGIILTRKGWQKIQDAKLEWELRDNKGNKFTLEDLSDRAGLTTATLRKILTRDQGVDKRSMVTLFTALNLELDPNDYTSPKSLKKPDNNKPTLKRVDWGEAVDVSTFYGRISELATLDKWLLEDSCRLITILGMGGIGKTALSVKLVEQIKDKYDYIIWRSLRDPSPIQEILTNLIQFLCDEETVKAKLPESTDEKISLLVECLRSSRCLIILDNVESLLCDSSRAGICDEEYEEYDKLFQRVGESEHQSCLLLTTREKPKQVAILEGEILPVRSLPLSGLKEKEGEAILKIKGLSGSEPEFAKLVARYDGNALALKIVGTTIRDLFGGNIAEFLRQDIAIFGDVRDLLNQQFNRLIDIEETIMYWLAINREPITLAQIQEDFVNSVSLSNLLEGLESLSRRCLIEKVESDATRTDSICFTLQSVVMEYVTKRLIEEVCQEIVIQHPNLFRLYALAKATAKDYIKETQIRLIVRPIIMRLFDALGSKSNIEEQLRQIIITLQETSPLQRGYTAGNILNLLCYLETDLTGYDFSNLCIWQADLQNVYLHDVSFQNADLAKTVFSETFGGVLSIAFSPDGEFLAAGDSNGDIHLWRVESHQQIFVFRGHTNWVVSLMFSPDGKTLCSGSGDSTVKLWNVETGVCKKTLREHQDEVWSVVFSPNGELLASGSDDNTIRIWNVSTSECLKIFTGHTSWVTSLAFSPDGEMLVSGSDDNTIRIWNVSTSECVKTLEGHSSGVRTIAITADNQLLGSGSEDNTIKLWNVTTGECLKTLTGHTNRVFSIAFSPKEDYIATSCHNYEIKLWNLTTGECLKTFKEHSGWIFSIAFSPKEGYLASGSNDQTVRLWNINTGQVWKKFQGYSNQVLSVASSSDGQRLASGSYDSRIRLWNINTGQILKEFQGHTNGVYSIAFSPQGNFLASGSEDKTIMLWEIGENKILRTLKGHSGSVRSIAFHPDGQIVASGSEDHTIRLWNFYTGQLLNIFQEHQADVWSVAFSPNGQTLASGSWDHSIKLWDINTNKCCRTLNGHTNWIWSVAFSPDSQKLASCSPDGTLKLWNIHTGECRKTLQITSGWLLSIAFSPDGKTLAGSCQDGTIKLWSLDTYECIKILSGHNAGWIWSIVFGNDSQVLVSGSEDETIKLWNVRTSDCLKTMKVKSPYQGLNLKRVSSLTEATKLGLKTLGAID